MINNQKKLVAPELQRLVAPGSPFEIMEDAHGLWAFRHAPATLIDLYKRVMKLSSDGALLATENGITTVRDFWHLASGVANGVRSDLIQAQAVRRIGIVLTNGVELAASLVGVTGAGAAAVLIPFDAGASRLASLCSLAGCDAVLTSRDLHPVVVKEIADVGVRVFEDMNLPPGMEPSEIWRSVFAQVAVGTEDNALIVFTSGSSAAPKAAITSHRGVIAGMWNMMLASAWTGLRNRMRGVGPEAGRGKGGQQCTFVAAPLTHVSGYTQLLLALSTGGRIAMLKDWDVGRAIEVANLGGATAISGASPAMIRDLLRLSRAGGAEMPMNSFGIHGLALRQSLVHEIQKEIPEARLMTGFGLTETNGSIASTSGAELLERMNTCGPVLPTVELDVVDENRNPLPQGSVGEIRVRGSMLFSGYCTSAGERSPMKPDEWFYTDDIGCVDGDGYLILLERGSDQLKVRGQEVRCAEVERHLDALGIGDDVVALGLLGGSMLLVGVSNPQDHFDAALVKARLQEEFSLPPESVKVIAKREFARTRSGKIDRYALAVSATADLNGGK